MGTSEGARKGWTEESRRKRAEAMRRKWEDPEYRARRAAKEQDPQTKANRSAGSARANADPEKRRKHSERMTEKWATDAEFRDRQAAGLRKAAEDPEYRRKRSESMKQAWLQNPQAFINSLRATLTDARSEEGRERRKKNMLKVAAANLPTDYELAVAYVLNEFDEWYNIHAIREDHEMDIYVPAHKLDIEVDGANHTTATGLSKDQERDKLLRERGYRVLRLRHREIDDGTYIEKIAEALG